MVKEIYAYLLIVPGLKSQLTSGLFHFKEQVLDAKLMGQASVPRRRASQRHPQALCLALCTASQLLLHLDYQQYSTWLACFFGIQPLVGETIPIDGKVLRGSYQLEEDNRHSAPHERDYASQRLYRGAGFDSRTL